MSPPAHPPTLVRGSDHTAPRVLCLEDRLPPPDRNERKEPDRTLWTLSQNTGSVGVGGDLVPIKAQAGDRIYEPLTYRPSFVGFNHRIVPGTD